MNLDLEKPSHQRTCYIGTKLTKMVGSACSFLQKGNDACCNRILLFALSGPHDPAATGRPDPSIARESEGNPKPGETGKGKVQLAHLGPEGRTTAREGAGLREHHVQRHRLLNSWTLRVITLTPLHTVRFKQLCRCEARYHPRSCTSVEFEARRLGVQEQLD